RRKPGGAPRRAADDPQLDDQPEDGQGARPDDPAGDPRPRDQDDRMRARFLLSLALAIPMLASAQPARGWRVRILSHRKPVRPPTPEPCDGFRRGLRELGYVEGKTLVIEWRHAGGRYEDLPRLAAELVKLNVDVIVVDGTPAVLAAQEATKKIP